MNTFCHVNECRRTLAKEACHLVLLDWCQGLEDLLQPLGKGLHIGRVIRRRVAFQCENTSRGRHCC